MRDVGGKIVVVLIVLLQYVLCRFEDTHVSVCHHLVLHNVAKKHRVSFAHRCSGRRVQRDEWILSIAETFPRGEKMKRIAFVGLLIVMTTGCGRGWLPTYWNGAPCNGCSLPAPIHTNNGCNSCADGAVNLGYAPYEGEVIGTGVDGYYDGQVISERVVPNNIQPLSAGSGTRS